MTFLIFLNFLLFIITLCSSSSLNDTNYDYIVENHDLILGVNFYPSLLIDLNDDETRDVQGNISIIFNNSTNTDGDISNSVSHISMYFSSSDDSILNIPNGCKLVMVNLTANTSYSDTDRNIQTAEFKFQVTGKFLGHGFVDVNFLVNWTEPSNTDADLSYDYRVAVVRRHRLIDTIFLSVVILFVTFGTISMGCKIDLNVVRDSLRRPVGPAIGFCCQFGIMPLIAFGVAMLMSLEGGVALGFFTAGCAPGGGMSNIYTFMFEGDVSLSVTMTLISTVASLGMIPFWLYTLGQVLMKTSGTEMDIKVPFTNIITSLIAIVVPLGIGLVIQRYRPKWADWLLRWTRPGVVIFIIFMFTFGVYANLYIFRLFTWQIVIAGTCLPYFGYISGGLIAFAFRMPRSSIIAICLETGIQNTGIAILLMKLSLPQPDADLSIIGPVVISMFTPAPLFVVIAIIEVKRCLDKRRKKAQDFESIKIADVSESDKDQKYITGTESSKDAEEPLNI